MKAAVLNHQPGVLEIEDLRIDDPGPGEVLLRTVGAGLRHSDLHFMEGVLTRSRFLPCWVTSRRASSKPSARA